MTDETGTILPFASPMDQSDPTWQNVEPNDLPREGIWHGSDIKGEDPEPTQAAKILFQAANLIDGDRDKQHGDRAKCLQQIADEWNTMVPTWDFAPIDVALMMAKVKLARIAIGSHNLDNYIDACGYLAIAGELAEKNK